MGFSWNAVLTGAGNGLRNFRQEQAQLEAQDFARGLSTRRLDLEERQIAANERRMQMQADEDAERQRQDAEDRELNVVMTYLNNLRPGDEIDPGMAPRVEKFRQFSGLLGTKPGEMTYANPEPWLGGNDSLDTVTGAPTSVFKGTPKQRAEKEAEALVKSQLDATVATLKELYPHPTPQQQAIIEAGVKSGMKPDDIVEAVAKSGAKPAGSGKLGTFEGYVESKYGANATPQQIIAARQEWARADDKPGGSGAGGGAGLTANQLRQQANELRKGYEKDTKPYHDVRTAHRNLQTTLGQESAAGDLAAIFQFMKALDPGSTVREGEFATAQNAAGVPTRILNWYNQIRTGQRLSPEQRKEFLAVSGGILATAEEDYRETRTAYEQDADYYGIPRARIIRDRSDDKDEKKPAAGKTPTAAELIAKYRKK